MLSQSVQSSSNSGGNQGIPKLSKRLGDCVACVGLLMFLPTVPLWFELWRTSSISESTIAIVVAMYSMTIGISTRFKWLFVIGVIVAIVFMGAFGMVVDGKTTLPQLKIIGYGVMGGFFVFHLCERIYRHIFQFEAFLEFSG